MKNNQRQIAIDFILFSKTTLLKSYIHCYIEVIHDGIFLTTSWYNFFFFVGFFGFVFWGDLFFFWGGVFF